jgi:hypothetical protein
MRRGEVTHRLNNPVDTAKIVVKNNHRSIDESRPQIVQSFRGRLVEVSINVYERYI